MVNAGCFELTEDELTIFSIYSVFAMMPEYVCGLGVFNQELDADPSISNDTALIQRMGCLIQTPCGPLIPIFSGYLLSLLTALE